MSADSLLAWRSLQAAMASAAPLCLGDSRFTSDSTADDSELAEFCAICPLRAACRAYSQIEKPHGFWSGTRYPRALGRPPTGGEPE